MSDMARLLEPLIPSLRRYARAMLRDSSAADDLVQDGLERAITRWHQRRADGDARSWLFAIVHNLAINRLRQSARRGPHLPLDSAEESGPTQPPRQEEGLRQRDLMRALETLPEEQRSVVLLVSVEDLSYAEVAHVLGVPVGTVMSRLSRGRERLRLAVDGGVASGPAGEARLRRIK
ncbi:RNA polymerase sigma factor (plasmid) [Roseomonas marmotae]|uniref:RNA polymerase sigma factor n=2 Tax=Roseomonas marmotae TaxID=2768161 RepID=A0ABS3KHQ6_9PROT|nr:RNA polymerase sigma factor [Roseomonas marmotae]MBO1075846.1 RNA polymerase sigma factor [Roseomonas marmotae]QTI82030.1 RNA polymerase sigma factor [Roseomonas marmotae]